MSGPALVPPPGSVVLVTGGAHGIGREYCGAFARAGARVVVADLDGGAARKAAVELGGEALAVAVDVADEQRVGTMIDVVTARLGGVDVLVNNAAVYATIPIRRAPLESLTVAEWDEVMATNLRGMFLCTRAVVPSMKARGGGRVVNIASGTLFNGTGALHYATSKAGVIGLTRAAALDLADFGITVNAISPGPVETELMLGAWTAEALRERPQHGAIARFGTVDEIAQVVAFLD